MAHAAPTELGESLRPLAINMSLLTEPGSQLFKLLLTRCQPTFQRTRAFAARSACQQTFDANVFIQFRPFDCATLAEQLPMLPFFRRTVQQARIPRQRSGERTAIRQFNEKLFIREAHVLNHRICFERQRSHFQICNLQSVIRNQFRNGLPVFSINAKRSCVAFVPHKLTKASRSMSSRYCSLTLLGRERLPPDRT